MKLIFFAASILFCTSAFAIAPVSPTGEVFGVSDGVFQCQSTLISGKPLVPNLKFTSVREVGQGVIVAHTTATLLGIKVANASARLQIQPTSATDFNLLDLDSGKICGRGTCEDTSCTFTATIMNGLLTLTETWLPQADGFDVENGSQLFKGLPATYSGEFRSTP